MEQRAKDILFSLGFGISALITITCFIPLITYIAFPTMLVFFVLWIKQTTIGQRVYEKYLEIIGGNEDIEDFEYND